MSDAPAWCALALSVGNTGYLAVRGVRSRKHTRAAGPASETRAALAAVRDAFQHIVTEGGVDSGWFLADPRPLRAEPLEDLAKRTADAQLAGAIRALAQVCRECFALAPEDRGPRVYSMGVHDPFADEYAQEDAEINAKKAVLTNRARQGRADCEAALERLNALEARL